MAFLDIKKAYDSVNRKLLMGKLEVRGICGNLKRFLKNFLNDERKARVILNVSKSDLLPFKSVVVPFTRKKIAKEDIKVKINNKEIRVSEDAKYLGVVFDRRLTWKKHIDEVRGKASKKAGILKWMINKYKIRQDLALTLYKTNVRPVIEYASEVWYDCSETHKAKIRSIEHKMITTALGLIKI